MADIEQRRLQVMDIFRVLINERPSELCFIDQNFEEVHDLQSPEERKIWCYYPHCLRDSVSPECGIFNRPGVAGAVL